MESYNLYSEIRTIRIELEAIKSGLELNVSKLRDNYQTELIQKGITKKLIDSVDDLLLSIQEKERNPSVVFQKAFSFLTQIEQIDFIAKNVMEALKRGESPSKIFKTYQDIGIFEKPVTAADDQPEFKEELTKFWFNLNYKTLKSLGTLGARLISKSLKKIPEFVKIKTHFSPIPPFISFSCDVEDSAGLDSLLELFQDSLKETNTIITG